ncbi:hypothetical protein M0654_03760 [Rhizobium sp. NTR19]|uniref:DUF4376 domain-containing protein n=1 Tax=Neorhizobium turbinariae TaxID=2937795 RepID=A0ABT0IML8_9HYPH|nr:hypothetical protein [Neorhizobium turbinariae]MCK8779096.1 hypothetical protein [Neorhizobium turbinariae]
MYRIDSMYEAMADAVVKAHQAQTVDRWVAASAIWLARQQIFGVQDFWYELAAKVTSLLPDADRLAIDEQLSRQEEKLFQNTGDWPVVPSGLHAVVDSWSPQEAEIDIDLLRAEMVAKVDREAEAYRLNFITAGDGQAMTYQQKLAEARAKLANTSIADAEIPHIVAEAEATGMTKTDVAQSIVDTFAGWQILSAGIEGKRMAAKKAIAEAEAAEAIKAAAAVSWSTE